MLNLGKSVKDQIRNQIQDKVRDQVWNQNEHITCSLVENELRYPVPYSQLQNPILEELYAKSR